jgi:hypothetical protein
MFGKDRKDESDHQLLMLYRISRSTGWMAFFTLVIAIGSAACAYFLWQQLTVMQDQLDNMQDLSSKIEKSLNVMQDLSSKIEKSLNVVNTQSATTSESAKSLLSLDRPWVGVDSVSVTPLLSNREFTIKASIRNGGRSPAIGMRMTFSTATPAANEIAVPNIEECDKCLRSTLLPNALITQEVTIDGDVFSAAKINRIKSGADTILLFGRIDYTDSTENHHTTTVCMAYVTSLPGFRNCVSDNRIE